VVDLLPPLTAEDLYDLRFAADPRICPDGERIAFVLKVVDREANDYRSHVWVVPFDGSHPAEQFTFGTRQDVSPRWSPDGRWLAFASDRLGIPSGSDRKKPPREVFVMPARGGEARGLTRIGEDCGDLAWTPSGDGIVFVAKDPRPAGTVDDGIRVYDRLRYRTDEGGLSDGRRKHVWLACLDGTPARKITDGDWDDAQPALSPDGTRIAFVSNRTERRYLNTVADIWTVAFDGSDARRLTDGRGAYGNPSWSPDGATITCYGVPVATGSNVSQNVHLWAFPSGATDATGRDLLAGWDRTVGSVVGTDMRAHAQTLPPAWDGAHERVRFVGADAGAANVYSCAADGGDVRLETTGAHHVVEVSFDRGMRRFAALLSTPTDPGNIVAGEPGGAMRLVTDVNGELLSRRWLAEPEPVAFTGADGWTIHGWLMRPRGFDPSRRWPLILEVHGGPHSAYGHSFFHEFHVDAGRGYGVLYTNPRGSHAYGETFVRAVVGDWGGKDFQDLMAGVDHVVAQGWVDERRLYLTGGSYGGFMTNWIVGHTDRFRAAATQRSISDNVAAYGTSDIGWHFWEQQMGDATPWRDGHKMAERSPLTYVERIRTPLLILHAERDLRCPIEQAEELFAALQVLGRESVFVRFPDDNHDLTRGGKPRNRVEHCRRIADWFDAHP
jgi:dipeptidyl aminopeptidase/acylaminoacyl peptidase